MAGIAGVFSWGIMFVVIGINSTSGHGIESGYVVLTVVSWALAFVAFFSTAWLVHRRRPRDVPA